MSQQKLTVCICGGGNGSHTAAGYIGSKSNYTVNVLTRKPQLWIEGMKEKGGLTIKTRKAESDEVVEIIGKINKVSDDAADVAKEADIFLLGGPAHANPDNLAKIAPHVKKGAIVGCLYAQGGFDWAVKNAIGKEKFKELGITTFGLQNIPWICKATIYGKEARMIGPKKFLLLASDPLENAQQMAKIVEGLFDIPVKLLPNFLCLTLTPSNQIIHPGRYYGIFKDWDGKKGYKQEDIPLLYDELDDFSADQLQELSDELQKVKNAITKKYPTIDLSPVMDLGERIVDQYGKDVKDTSSLRSIFNTNKGYEGVKTPVLQREDGLVIPNTTCRFFTEDLPFGLCILHNIGELAGVETPVFDRFIAWFQQFMGKEYITKDNKLNEDLIPETGTPKRYGITNIDELVENCLPKQA